MLFYWTVTTPQVVSNTLRSCFVLQPNIHLFKLKGVLVCRYSQLLHIWLHLEKNPLYEFIYHIIFREQNILILVSKLRCEHFQTVLQLKQIN